MRTILCLLLVLGGCDTSEKTAQKGHAGELPSGEEASAEPEVTPVVPNLKYKIGGDAITITGCDKGVSGAFVIPDTIRGKPVTSIGDSAFFMSSKLTSITIPEGVTSIEAGAFFLCTVLTRITIPEEVISIGNSAFHSCRSLTRITIPEGVTSIGDYTFADCTSLKGITIGVSVTSIGQSTFHGCISLTNLTIPDSVTSIGNSAFHSCKSLTSLTISDSVTNIGWRAFEDCTSLKSVIFQGSAPPKVGKEVFAEASPTIYRKPDAKGWGDTWADRPVKLISE